MKHRLPVILFVILAAIGLHACSGSKSYSNKAIQMQKEGMNDEAAEFFLIALQRNPKNVDAKIGLKQTGQIQIENTLTKFYKSYSVGNHKEAVYLYQQALDYHTRYGQFVSLEFPSYYEEYYKEMLTTYLHKRYMEAQDLVYEERFKEANDIFNEILRLDPEYKDVQEQSLHTEVEPIYRKGLNLFDNQKYRACYVAMGTVLDKIANYKDAMDYKERALENGRVNIAVMEFSHANHKLDQVSDALQSNVVSGLAQLNDPFLRVIDRTNTNTLIKEQKINVSQASMGQSAIQTGELLGANMLVTGKVISYTPRIGKVNMYRRQGFEKYKVKVKNTDNDKYHWETRYRRVMYWEYEGSSSVYVEIQYQIVSAQTGQVLGSNTVKKQVSDKVNYVTYKGNVKNLYSGK
jgi:curli biogenesis system outer membrane secretion channel CsgG